MVGARGFEPPTSSTPLNRATELRYAPTSRASIAHRRTVGKQTAKSKNGTLINTFASFSGSAGSRLTVNAAQCSHELNDVARNK